MKEVKSSGVSSSMFFHESDKYSGHLLVAHPLNPQNQLAHSVIMLGPRSNAKSILGFQINTVLDEVSLRDIMENLGFYIDYDQPVYSGGKLGLNRLHLVHSLDWIGMNTVRLTDQIGVTGDISILAALSENEGPEYFRACAGNWQWSSGMLREQLNFNSESEYRWNLMPATVENTFNLEGSEQWTSLWRSQAQVQIDQWFNRVQG